MFRCLACKEIESWWLHVNLISESSANLLQCTEDLAIIFSRSYCCTQYDRLLAWYCRLSVCLMKCIVMLTDRGCTLYLRVPRRALPIHFFRHCCCRMYRSATTHTEKLNRRNFRVWNGHGRRGHVTTAIPDAAFLAVRPRSTQTSISPR